MKKLSNFTDSALSREQMKKVSGGCGIKCGGSWSYGYSSADAQSWMGGSCTNWCCQHCPQT